MADGMRAPKVPGVELRPIPGVIGYAAGSDGEIYSFRNGGHQTPQNRYRLTPIQLSPAVCRDGRRHLGISWRGRTFSTVATLVCSAFHGPRPPGMTCSHLNGRAFDDRPENLTWESYKDNERRKVSHGTSNRGEGSGRAKLTSKEVLQIREVYDSGEMTQGELASFYGVTREAINAIVNRRRWKHLEGGC